jgi:hypothetical protein
MNKRGQTIFGMSFGMIFSIIIIIFIIATAFFAINYFLEFDNCSEIGLFYNDLQREVDKAWNSGRFEGQWPPEGQNIKLPSRNPSLEWICFGDLVTTSPNSNSPKDVELNNIFKDSYSTSGENVFLHPQENACDAGLSRFKLEHIKTKDNNFFCIEVTKGKLEDPLILTISRGSNLVTIGEFED